MQKEKVFSHLPGQKKGRPSGQEQRPAAFMVAVVQQLLDSCRSSAGLRVNTGRAYFGWKGECLCPPVS